MDACHSEGRRIAGEIATEEGGPSGPTASKCQRVEGVQSSQVTGGSEMNRMRGWEWISAKRVFQLHWGEPETGEIVAPAALKAEKFLEHLLIVPTVCSEWKVRRDCSTGRDRCRSSVTRSNYCPWRMVKPFVAGHNKNEAADARGIWMATATAGDQSVAVKSGSSKTVVGCIGMREQLVMTFRTARSMGCEGVLNRVRRSDCRRAGRIKRESRAFGAISARLPAIVNRDPGEQYSGGRARRARFLARDRAAITPKAARGLGDPAQLRRSWRGAWMSADRGGSDEGECESFKSGRELRLGSGLVHGKPHGAGRVRLLGIQQARR